MQNYGPILKGRTKFRLSATAILIIINVICFIAFRILLSAKPALTGYIGLVPSNILHGKALWTLLTSIFMHINLTHLLFNMISLFFVGTFLEKLIGKKRFVWFYLLSGIFAGLVFSLLAGFFGNSIIGAKLFGSPLIVGAGASGAIFGLVGVLAVLTPRNKISLIAGPLIAIVLEYFLQNVFPNASFLNAVFIIINIYIFASIFVIFSFNPKITKFALPVQMPFWALPIAAIIPLVIVGLFVHLPIGNSAHFGGLVAGLAYGFFLRKKFPKKTKMIASMFSR